MSEDEDKILCYGDHLIISTGDGINTHYLSARSRKENKIKVTTRRIVKGAPQDSCTPLYFHPNLNQLIFKIEPKMDYSALQDLKKIRSGDPRENLLTRRSEAEKIKNHHFETKMRGVPVRYGETIQLYHEFTQSYVCVTRNKMPEVNKYFIGLSKSGKEEIHFKIQTNESKPKNGLKILNGEKIALININSML